MRIVMLGTRGVPARYGGFETCIEEVGSRLVAAGHEVTVYCRNTTGEDMPTSYRGMDLVTLPAVPHKVAETLSHSAISVGHVVARRRPDAALLFNAANAPGGVIASKQRPGEGAWSGEVAGGWDSAEVDR
ncbi:MAG TPA: glycosyltransferase, partial [Dermatophilaceae bacterium]|nr:glycosyltransferase [Dermatophilaceae bacterium]